MHYVLQKFSNSIYSICVLYMSVSGLNTEANVDEHFIDATFINEDFDYDPFATQRFDQFYSCKRPMLCLSLCLPSI